MLGRLALTDRRGEMVEKLSGGLRRRVELAKGMLHRPRLLLLGRAEHRPRSGRRSDLWDYLQQIRREDGVTVVLTTHLLEEADKADRIAILNEGSLVALDTPEALRATVGGDSITIQTDDPGMRDGSRRSRARFGCPASVLAGRGAAGAARRASMDRPAGRGVSRPDSSDHAGQADARRRVHRPHRASLLAPAQRRWALAETLANTVRPGRSRRTTTSQPIAEPCPWQAAWTLCRREWVRFVRQRNRVFGAIGQPLFFWLLFGVGFGSSFRMGASSTERPDSYFEYFFPGTLVLILLFTAIFATISVIEDRREGFLQSVLVAPIPRWSMVLGKMLGGTLIAVAQGDRCSCCWATRWHLHLGPLAAGWRSWRGCSSWRWR